MSRNLLHHNKLNDFKNFLISYKIPYRKGQGDFQVMQVLVDGKWQPVYNRLQSKEHYTVVRPLEGLVEMFINENKRARTN